MTRLKAILSLALAACGSGVFAGNSLAAVTEVDNFSTSQTGFDANISSMDLIENGSSALSGVTYSGSISGYAGDVPPYNNFSNLTDGLASTKVTNNDISHDTYFDTGSWPTNPSATYTFSNPGGVTLTSINSISGWADTDSFSHQTYNVVLYYASAPSTPVPLASVDYNPWASNSPGPGGSNSTQVTLTGGSGPLATGVAAIQFQFLNNGGSGQVFREIDVQGIVPEPASLSVLGLGAIGLLSRRRRA